ncbi:S-layer homology domain-containing protein [Paenibacillus sp. GCM10027626]|uniref:S-layer homology domain-containing protein n=1 Tax=Paenibacillus sp. GCM10027626 TaxID=3273411 RepID=UPI003644361D
MNKRTLTAAVLSCALVLPVAGQAFAATTAFTDIGKNSARTQIESLKERGIVHGVSATEFKPDTAVTVSQGAAMIVKSMNLSLAAFTFIKEPLASDMFSKVTNDKAWYANAMMVAKINGVDLPADVDPNEQLTREAFLHYLIQGLESTGNYPLFKMYITINDEDQIEPSYQGSIQRALIYKLTELDADGNFNPKQIITRGEAAAILYNAIAFAENHQKEPAVPADQVDPNNGSTDETVSTETQ